jgi:hypothetical protein
VGFTLADREKYGSGFTFFYRKTGAHKKAAKHLLIKSRWLAAKALLEKINGYNG